MLKNNRTRAQLCSINWGLDLLTLRQQEVSTLIHILHIETSIFRLRHFGGFDFSRFRPFGASKIEVPAYKGFEILRPTTYWGFVILRLRRPSYYEYFFVLVDIYKILQNTMVFALFAGRYHRAAKDSPRYMV